MRGAGSLGPCHLKKWEAIVGFKRCHELTSYFKRIPLTVVIEIDCGGQGGKDKSRETY